MKFIDATPGEDKDFEKYSNDVQAIRGKILDILFEFHLKYIAADNPRYSGRVIGEALSIIIPNFVACALNDFSDMEDYINKIFKSAIKNLNAANTVISRDDKNE